MPAVPTSSLVEENGTLTLSFHCALCGHPSFTSGIDPGQYAAYTDGAFVQDAFPHLTPGQRETLVSGSHEACFDAAFAEEPAAPEMDADTARSYLDGVTESDRPLLMETWEAVTSCRQDVERSPRWPADYDPVETVMSTGSWPEHFAVALVNIRQAAHRDEAWGKCPNCGLISSVAGAQTVCSEACFNSYSRYINSV